MQQENYDFLGTRIHLRGPTKFQTSIDLRTTMPSTLRNERKEVKVNIVKQKHIEEQIRITTFELVLQTINLQHHRVRLDKWRLFSTLLITAHHFSFWRKKLTLID